jgi:transposase
MGKAINSFIDSKENEQDNRETVLLKYLDFLNPSGERNKIVVKKNKKSPKTRLVTEVRTVEYVYPNEKPDKTKTTAGFEIANEILVDRDDPRLFSETFLPKIIGHVTRTVKLKKIVNE